LKLENILRNNRNVVFLNIYHENAPKIGMESVVNDREIYNSIKRLYDIPVVPSTFIVDRRGYIRATVLGFNKELDLITDLKERIECLIKEK
jgi:hypothetical protein